MPQTCYRHPNRETNVACSNCERPICPECMVDTPVGMRCPECAGRKSGAKRAAAVLKTSTTPYATYTLLGLNVLVFIAALGGGGNAGSLEGGGQLLNDGGLYGPSVAAGEWYRIITSGFLHAGPLHLLMNMFVLYILGSLLEPAVGSLRFAAIYFVSLLAGSFGALLLSPNDLTVGASGAIYGLLAATFVIARRRGLEQVASQVGIWMVINLAFTFAVPNISIGGHIGGMVGGALAALVISFGERQGRGNVPIEVGGLSLVAAVAIAGTLIFAETI